MRLAVLIAILVASVCAPGSAATYKAAAMTLAELREHHLEAVGTRVEPQTVREEWSFAKAGLTGTQTTISSAGDVRTAVSEGPVHWEYGRSNGHDWWHNKNGITLYVSVLHRQSVRDNSALPSEDASPQALLLGMVEAPSPCYVVDINPNARHHEHVFYDASSWLIVRREKSYAHETQVETLDDYRRVSGQMRPFHIHNSNGRPGGDTDWRLKRIELNAEVLPDEVAVPATNVNISMPARANEVRLPAAFVNGHIVVRVNVNGRGLDFQLDSGTSGIILDQATADSLGLKRYALRAGQGPSVRDESDAIIPELRVGAVQMRDVVVNTLPFQAQENASTKVVGLLGFDFLAEGVIRINYEAETLTFINPARFTPPPSSSSLDALLDDAVPIVNATVGSAAGAFILDTGSDVPLIFSRFAAEHPGDVDDQGIGREVRGAIGVAGVDGPHDVRSVKLGTFHLGASDFEGVLAVVTPKGDSYEGEEIDGTIGISLLSHFVVDLDYGNARVVLEDPSSR